MSKYGKIQGITKLEDIEILQLVASAEQHRYSKSGDYSVTELINPVRVGQLKKRYGAVAVPKLQSRIASMMGTAAHEFFEKYLNLAMQSSDYNTWPYYIEQQMKQEFPVHTADGNEIRTVSGRYDFRKESTIYDLKNIKCWKLIFDPHFEEFHQQQNLYAYLLGLEGTKINRLEILANYKDWQAGSALRDKNYPQQPFLGYTLELWDEDRQEEYLFERLQAHVNHEDTKDEDLPVCTREERWERHMGGEIIHYAILKNRKAKRATKVVKGGALEEAIVIANGMKGMTTDSCIEIRYAKPKRCVDYCEINEYCSFYQNWAAKNGKVDEYINFKF